MSTLSGNSVASADDLIKYWAGKDSKFLFKNLKSWVKKENASEEVKKMKRLQNGAKRIIKIEVSATLFYNK